MTHPFRYVLTTRYKSRLIRSLLKGESCTRLLDIGCGGGFMLSELGDVFETAEGIDMSPEAIEFGGQFTGARMSVANAEQLPFDTDEFDAIVTTDAFEHIPDDAAAMREAFRVLKPEGAMALYTPTENGLLSKTPFAEYYHDSEHSYLLDQRYYTKESLRLLAEQAGFTVEFLGYHSVFFQEFFTQTFKVAARLLGFRYENQSNISNFTSSRLFPLYRWFMLPVMDLVILTEDLLFWRLLQGRVRGHRLELKSRKPR